MTQIINPNKLPYINATLKKVRKFYQQNPIVVQKFDADGNQISEQRVSVNPSKYKKIKNKPFKTKKSYKVKKGGLYRV